ncbi:MAG: DUF63 family protein [Candidatus Thermoplasmatota archaeon]|nr:DUF63 family protein [Candidatus Thermoplasmatota archaeon]
MRLQSYLSENKFFRAGIIAASALILFFLLWYFFPELVYDQFIWKYFWGPISSDGLNTPMTYRGVDAAPKFTLISEFVYGVFVAGALYGLYKLLKKFNVTVDFSFFLGTFPFIVYGSVARVLEDAQLFTEPLVFWFVTPLIYIQTLLFALVALVIGVYFHDVKKITRLSVQQIMGISGSVLLLPFAYYVVLWMSGGAWNGSNEIFPNVVVLVSVICIVIMLAVYALSKYGQSYWKELSYFSTPFNLSMIFGHQLDGIATYISIYDPLQMGLPTYIEKHPASDILMQIWPPLFPIVKFLLIIGIIYVIDILYKEELQSQKIFVNLLKIGIFILGFAPGLRDLLRVAMGV